MLKTLLTAKWLAFTVVVVAVAVGFCALAWWQWGQYQATGGSLQNLAYVLQWPVFAAFGVYMWWRMLREAVRGVPEPAAELVEEAELVEAEQAKRQSGAVVLARDVEIDDELVAYNRYLAALHARSGGGEGAQP